MRIIVRGSALNGVGVVSGMLQLVDVFVKAQSAMLRKGPVLSARCRIDKLKLVAHSPEKDHPRVSCRYLIR